MVKTQHYSLKQTKRLAHQSGKQVSKETLFLLRHLSEEIILYLTIGAANRTRYNRIRKKDIQVSPDLNKHIQDIVNNFHIEQKPSNPLSYLNNSKKPPLKEEPRTIYRARGIFS